MANKLPEGQFQITEGPSKFDLMCSLFEGKVVEITCEMSPRVTGKIQINPKLKVIFSKIGPEDGSYNSWIGEVSFLSSHGYDSERRGFYFDIKRRIGYITAKAKNQV